MTTPLSARPQLFALHASDRGPVLCVNADGWDRRDIVSGHRTPDGIVVDIDHRHIYWTNLGFRRTLTAGSSAQALTEPILRAGIEMPAGGGASLGSDSEVLSLGLLEPIDLEVGLGTRAAYGADRGDLPRGNTVNGAPMDAPDGRREPPEILVCRLMEGIGLALDPSGERMFVSDVAADVHEAGLDGSDPPGDHGRAGQPHRHRSRRASRRGMMT